MRGIPIPAVYQRGQVDAQLERGKCVIGLPDGGGDGVGCLPCNTVRFGAVIRTCRMPVASPSSMPVASPSPNSVP